MKTQVPEGKAIVLLNLREGEGSQPIDKLPSALIEQLAKVIDKKGFMVVSSSEYHNIAVNIFANINRETAAFIFDDDLKKRWNREDMGLLQIKDFIEGFWKLFPNVEVTVFLSSKEDIDWLPNFWGWNMKVNTEVGEALILTSKECQLL